MISHLIKCATLKLNRDQVMDLETWFKSYTNASNYMVACLKTM